MVPWANANLGQGNVQVSGEKESNKEGKLVSSTNPKYNPEPFLSSVKSTYLSLYFLWSSPYILPLCQLPPFGVSLSTYIYPSL